MEQFAVARSGGSSRAGAERRMMFMGLIAAFTGLVIAGCDSGGGSGSSTRPLSGRVADGYLVNAQVCLDVNGNAACDDNEPSTQTTAGGQYTLPDITTDQYNNGQLLVQVTTQTQDEDDNGFVTEPYKLSSPQGGESFVSPVTTLVARALENDPFLDQDDALADLALTLGQADPDALLADFVANGSAGNADAQFLHEIAQVLADTLGTVKQDLETDLTNSGSDPEAQAAAVEATLVAALTRSLSAVVAVADGETGAQAKLNEAMDESATVEAVDQMADQQASQPVSTNAVKAVFEQGFQSFDEDVFLNDECEDGSAVLCFGIGTFNTEAGSDRMNRVFTSHEFTNAGTALTPTSSVGGSGCECDDSGMVWVLNDNDQFEKVSYVGVWYGYRVNDNGTLSEDILYLGSEPTEDEADWDYDLLQPHTLAKVVNTDTVRLKSRDIAGETLTSALQRMSPDSAEAIADFITPLSDTLTFPAGSISYWFTFPETNLEPIIQDHGNDTLRTVDATGECVETGGVCGKTFDSLNDLFALPANEAMAGQGEYLGEEYNYQILFNPSDSGQSSGTATLTRWYNNGGGLVEDTDFEADLPWTRQTWHGKESIVLDRLVAHRYGLQQRALVDTGNGGGQPVLWAEMESPSGSGAALMLNDTAMDALVSELNAVFSTEAATL